MAHRGWRRVLLRGSLLTLLAFGTALAQDAYLHTDDGCAVETHCLACRWHLGTTGTIAEATPLALSCPVAQPVRSFLEPHPADGEVRVAAARGPPLS